MRMTPAVLVVAAGLIAGLAACEKKEVGGGSAGGQTGAQAGGQAGGHDHADGEHADHEHGHGDHGAAIDLGTATVGPFGVQASRDEGAFEAGQEAAIDVTVTPAAEGGPKVGAVRFWIGTEDAAGSLKARAEIENPAEPSRWHTHAEIPSPLPAGSRLWVEIEDDKGATHVGSFDLKTGG